jgi:L-galactose dehydrogenase
MEYRTLGRTGLNVSLLGLGSGGASRLGQRYNLSTSETERLVKRALDSGVNLIDTAPTYSQSESLLGEALQGVPRDKYVLCTKFQPNAGGDQLHSPADLRESLEQSLRALRTDFVEVFYLHGVAPGRYAAVRDHFLPELKTVQKEGLIKHIGITEQYQTDHQHQMAPMAINDGDFDVIMVGFNLLSPYAVTSVLPLAQQHQVGIVVMCAVRSVLINPTAVTACVREWEHEGLLERGAVKPEAPLDWLLDDQTPSIAAAAYKFAAAHPAVGTVLTGTASLDHFESNLQAILGPPLPKAKFQRVQDVFGPVQRNVQPERVSR